MSDAKGCVPPDLQSGFQIQFKPDPNWWKQFRLPSLEEELEMLHCGIDFGCGGETIEEELEITPDGCVVIATLRHPIFPQALPTELKGIAV